MLDPRKIEFRLLNCSQFYPEEVERLKRLTGTFPGRDQCRCLSEALLECCFDPCILISSVDQVAEQPAIAL